jgi:uncharacterized MAPEG superfamily protein
MSPELYWMTLTAAMTGLMFVPYMQDRVNILGLFGAMGNPYELIVVKPQSPWAVRAMHAHRNAVENLVVFVAFVLVLNALSVSTRTTALACAIYFWARLVHYILYLLGVRVLRTLVWIVGLLCLLTLFLAIFRVV